MKNTDLFSMGAAVPNASSRRPSRMPTLSPMHGLMSPGLFISNSLPGEPHMEHLPPRRSVPHPSHHLRTSFPLAALTCT